MARKRSSVKSHLERFKRAAKIKALAERAGTSGEQQAAEAALQRLGATPSDIAFGNLALTLDERKAAHDQRRTVARQQRNPKRAGTWCRARADATPQAQR